MIDAANFFFFCPEQLQFSCERLRWSFLSPGLGVGFVSDFGTLRQADNHLTELEQNLRMVSVMKGSVNRAILTVREGRLQQ